MASAKKNVEVVETVKGVTLELSVDEAQMLTALLGKCRRNHNTTPIFKALTEAGIEKGDWKVEANGDGFVSVPTLVLHRKIIGEW